MYPVYGYRFTEDELQLYVEMHGLRRRVATQSSEQPDPQGMLAPAPVITTRPPPTDDEYSETSSDLQTLGSASSGGGIPGQRSGYVDSEMEQQESEESEVVSASPST